MIIRSSGHDGLLDPIATTWSPERPILVVARNSGQDGRNSRRQAINDLLDACDRLKAAGCDVTDALPDEHRLHELLRHADPVRSKDKYGRTFLNRMVTIDLRATHGVYVVLSVGTGRKLDEQGTQPFVQYLAQTVIAIRPCLVFAKRLDRISRRAWALGILMLNLTELKAYIGDAVFGLSDADGIESILVFFRAQAGEEEARGIPKKTRSGMRRETGTSLSSGSCPYAVAAPVPPGFMSYRPVDRGMLERRIITFDTPSCHPSAELMCVGLPEVTIEDDEGNPTRVDQVDNVRWALQRLGHPGWPAPAIANGLVARGFSTEGLRRTHGPDAKVTAFHSETAAYRVIASIQNHLDLYETGIMNLELGVQDVEPVVITDCFPPDGEQWASAADFARIRNWMLHNSRPARRTNVLSGFPVVANGTACLLIRTTAGPTPSTLTAVIKEDYRANGRQLSPGVPIIIEPEMIIEPFVNAIADLGDTALALVPFEIDDDDVTEMEIHNARSRLKVLLDERNAIEEQLLTRAPDGQNLISGALLRRLNERYNQIADVEEPAAQIEITSLEAQRDARRLRMVRERTGVATDRLLGLIAALRDPTNTDHRELLQRTIKDLRIDTTRCTSHRRVWWEYLIRYTIHITTDTGTITVPVEHHAQHGNTFDPRKLAEGVHTAMCAAPITWRQLAPADDGLMRRELGQALELPARCFMLPNVDDPRLAHLAALTLTNANNLAQIAADTGENVTLLKRILDAHRNAPRAVWLTRPRPTIAAWYRLGALGPITCDGIAEAAGSTLATARNLLYASADRHNWSLTNDGYVLAPCPSCGSRRRSPALIPEPLGLVCLNCETDEAGERWPSATYGRFLVVGEP